LYSNRRSIAVTLALLLAVTLAPAGAGAAPQRDPGNERERVRQRRAQVASQIDALKAEDREVEAALDALNANVATQRARLADAQRSVDRAEQEVVAARAEETKTAAEIAQLHTEVKKLAVEAYTGGGPADLGGSLLDSDNANDAARRSTFVDVAFGNAADSADRLQAAREDLEIARQDKESAAAEAAARREEVRQRLGPLTAARDQQAAFADKVEARIEARLAEAASLGHLDSRLSAEIVSRQAALASRTQGGRATAGPARSVGNVPLRNVRGIWVHESLADQLERLLSAAAADGFSLSGGGYRDPAQQQRLREANCPDPNNSPASSCRPPTARPGQSMHERGLAVDFTYQGRIISSRSNPAYRWLSANASRFGLRNLPSEPWHWSTNGN